MKPTVNLIMQLHKDEIDGTPGWSWNILSINTLLLYMSLLMYF